MLVLPLTRDPSQTLDIVLDGVRVTLTVRWAPRVGGWFLDARYPGGDYLVAGRQVASFSPLLPPVDGMNGELVCLPAAGRDSEPGLMAWGSTHQLVYR